MRTVFARLSLVFLLLIAGTTLLAQEFTGTAAQGFVQGASKVWVKEGHTYPSFIAFAEGHHIPQQEASTWFRRQFGFSEEVTLTEVSRETDLRGDLHLRVKLALQGIPLFDGMLVLHIRNGMIYSMNGDIPEQLSVTNLVSITEADALQCALQHINATRYKWEMPEEEALLKYQLDDPAATYFPAGQVKLYRPDRTSNYRYVYVFNIYADAPLYRAEVFVDASTGAILWEHNKIHETDVTGTAVTKYSGTQTITTDSTGTTYRLRETGRGNGIETYNMLKGTNYGNAVDFTDSDNYWNNFNANKDEVATDAHWGSESTWDYLWYKFNRNSINNNGFKLLSYVHYDNNYANAFWDGQRMTYGDGNGTSMGPLTALDIIAHEITHGLTTNTANLVYQNEPGALNEGFSDIFGVAVEWYAKPSMANWTMGENIGVTIRSISNPKSKGLPNTYLGQYWYTGTGDNGGVHTNNGPLAYWFYLLSNGGSGTNDNGHTYSIPSITMDSAAFIAYRMLTVYLTNTSQYIDARYYAIQSAIDLFGPCSPQVAATTNAMYAIGVGAAYIPGVISDFSAPLTQFCIAPATVAFSNLSNNGQTYMWDFGNGQTSTSQNPTHTYNTAGTYTVTLIADGGTCGRDTLVKTAYISIGAHNPCSYNMPQTTTVTNTECTGFLFDSGGNQNYHNNTNGTFIISPPGAMTVTLTFQSFSFESGYDYLYIYDGVGTSAPLIGQFSGNNLPNGGTISSTSGHITLRQASDQYMTESGFMLAWNCSYPTAAPLSDFMISDTLTCDGTILFSDISSNGPNSWLWEFGDGNTATTKVATHTYSQSGVYDVKLTTSNSFGAHTVTKYGVVKVELPFPEVATMAVCDSGSVVLFNPDTTVITRWYDDSQSSAPFHTGHSYTTPVVNQTTTFWVEEVIERNVHTGAKLNNGGGGSYFTAAVKHYLVFDVYKTSILQSVLVYAGSNGNRTIELANSTGTVLKSATVALTQGANVVTLNFEIQPGTGYRLVGPTSPNLYRNDNGISFPYHIGNLMSVTHSSASTNPTGYYYFFYQWKVSELPCISPKVPVEVIVNTLPPVADFSFTQMDPSVTFTDLTLHKGMNTWSFGDGASSTGYNPTHAYGAIGTYQVNLLVNNGCGTDQITKQVNITTMSVDEPVVYAEMQVYPNPTSGQFIVQWVGEASVNPAGLRIYDLRGRLVAADVSAETQQSVRVTLRDARPGIYLITLQGETTMYRERIIVR